MSFEVEVKFRVADHPGLHARLAGLGAVAADRVDQVDVYLAHPARDFAQTDEALRIRSDGPSNHVTYKGPKRGGPTKTREEIEIPFSAEPQARDQFVRLFDRLGFRQVARITKTRTGYNLSYNSRPMHVALDQAGELGSFAEVETIAAAEADLPAAQEAVLALARELDLSEVEPRSYLRMALERARNSAGPT